MAFPGPRLLNLHSPACAEHCCVCSQNKGPELQTCTRCSSEGATTARITQTEGKDVSVRNARSGGEERATGVVEEDQDTWWGWSQKICQP